MKLVSSRNQIIYKPAKEVELSEQGLEEAQRVLTMLNEKLDAEPTAQGLSGNQVGRLLRVMICVFRGKRLEIINPELVWVYGRRESNEGCLSVKGRYIVKRPLIGKVKYISVDGRTITRVFTYKKLRVFMHELDHLNGKCLPDVGTLWKYSKLYYTVKKNS